MQRLSGLDASFLYFETRAQLLHVCGLIVLDGSEMEGGYSFDALRAELARRVKGMPNFRRKLHDSLLNIDHPVWVEDEDFDVDHHLHRVGLPEPGGDRELAELCGHLASQPIDRSMPLWQMYVIEGLRDGQFAVFAKMHHSTVDGVTGANMVSQLCTLTPDDPALDQELVEETAGGSGALELAVGGALSRLATPWRLASLLPGTLGVLPSWISRARKGLAMPAPFTAPRTPFNRTITGHRSISYASVDLDEIKRIKNAFGTTVNDVVLAICSTALRRYLADLEELPSKPLIAMVPMSVHAAESRPGTNRVSGMFMSLSTDVDDPVERLESIRDANTVAKDHTDALDANLLTDWAQFAAPSVFGSAVRMYSRLRLSERHPVVHNLVISNVPGPNIPLYFLGAKITKMLPMGPVFHGAGLNCTVMSLDGELHFGFIACKDLVPDPWPLADAVDAAMEEFSRAADEREASGTPSAERLSATELGQLRKDLKRSDRQANRDRSTTTAEPAAETRAAEKAPAKKAAAKKAPAKKAPAKRTAAEKAPAKKAPAKKTPAKKTAAEKAPATKSSAKKSPAKKTATNKTAANKTAANKTPATRASGKPTGSKPVSTRKPTPGPGEAATPAPDAAPAAQTYSAPPVTPEAPAGPPSGTVGSVPTQDNAPTAEPAPGTEPSPDVAGPTYGAPAAAVPDEAAATSGAGGGATGSDAASGRS
jgi:diacylglycerol O-acyltransferase